MDPAERPGTPSTVMAPGRVIAVEPAGPEGKTHVISLDCGSVGRWVPLVVPPEAAERAVTSPGSAAVLAAEPGGHAS
ncbi:hypothetical protein [Streptomyces collinus]|uniref:hypothetical protein n=1 Tax=Streptomyces collinus TaxID=42684 RepID=UPI0036E055B1